MEREIGRKQKPKGKNRRNAGGLRQVVAREEMKQTIEPEFRDWLVVARAGSRDTQTGGFAVHGLGARGFRPACEAEASRSQGTTPWAGSL
jgi:hypothetical protein